MPEIRLNKRRLLRPQQPVPVDRAVGDRTPALLQQTGLHQHDRLAGTGLEEPVHAVEQRLQLEDAVLEPDAQGDQPFPRPVECDQLAHHARKQRQHEDGDEPYP